MDNNEIDTKEEQPDTVEFVYGAVPIADSLHKTGEQKLDEPSLLSSYRKLSDESKEKVKDFIDKLIAEQTQPDTVDPWKSPDNPWLQLKGIFANDSDFDDVLKEIERNRKEAD